MTAPNPRSIVGTRWLTVFDSSGVSVHVSPVGAAVGSGLDALDAHARPRARGLEDRLLAFDDREGGVGEVDGVVNNELHVGLAPSVEIPASTSIPQVRAVTGSPARRPSAAAFHRPLGPSVVTTDSVTPERVTGHSAGADSSHSLLAVPSALSSSIARLSRIVRSSVIARSPRARARRTTLPAVTSAVVPG